MLSKWNKAYFPCSASRKKQTCTSHSTPESEIVAAWRGIRTTGIPVKDLMQVVVNVMQMHNCGHLDPRVYKSVSLKLYEDNDAAILIMKSGVTKEVRHIMRTHRISIRGLFDTYKQGIYTPVYCPTAMQCADVFT